MRIIVNTTRIQKKGERRAYEHPYQSDLMHGVCDPDIMNTHYTPTSGMLARPNKQYRYEFQVSVAKAELEQCLHKTNFPAGTLSSHIHNRHWFEYFV